MVIENVLPFLFWHNPHTRLFHSMPPMTKATSTNITTCIRAACSKLRMLSRAAMGKSAHNQKHAAGCSGRMMASPSTGLCTLYPKPTYLINPTLRLLSRTQIHNGNHNTPHTTCSDTLESLSHTHHHAHTNLHTYPLRTSKHRKTTMRCSCWANCCCKLLMLNSQTPTPPHVVVEWPAPTVLWITTTTGCTIAMLQHSLHTIHPYAFNLWQPAVNNEHLAKYNNHLRTTLSYNSNITTITQQHHYL